MSFYRTRHPDGPFATLIGVAATCLHPEADRPGELRSRARSASEDNEEIRTFKADRRTRTVLDVTCHARLTSLAASVRGRHASPLGVFAVFTLAPGCSPWRLQWPHGYPGSRHGRWPGPRYDARDPPPSTRFDRNKSVSQVHLH